MSNINPFAPVQDLGVGDALEHWRWLVGSNAKPRLLTAMGDVFIVKTRWLGSDPVYLLDSCSGEFKKVTDTWAQFKKRMAAPDDETSSWLKYGLLLAIESASGELERGHCYSQKIPTILGGAYEPGNFESSSWRVHLSVLGQVHEQVKKLPAATPVSGVTLKHGDA